MISALRFSTLANKANVPRNLRNHSGDTMATALNEKESGVQTGGRSNHEVLITAFLHGDCCSEGTDRSGGHSSGVLGQQGLQRPWAHRPWHPQVLTLVRAGAAQSPALPPSLSQM